MTAIERLIAAALLALILLVAGWFGVHNYGVQRWQAGYDQAVADGKARRDLEATVAQEREDALRAELRAKDAAEFIKEKKHAASLEAAQRRVRAGDDRLRCPAGPVSAAATAGDRPAAGGPGVDGEGQAIVPEVAAEILGDGADVAGLVRRYERVVERFEACRALNAK